MYMNTDEINEELAIMQLSDSFFPTGLYATSNGLEFLFSKNEIKGVEDIKNMNPQKIKNPKNLPKLN